jgi:hypothetical protein
MCQQHSENVIRYNHARSRFISKLRIESEAQVREKLDGLLKVFDREIDKYLTNHKFEF